MFPLLQVYVPLYIIVMSSWVTFWLVKTDKGQETPARTQLGATTVLAVVTIGFGGKAKPQVGYCTDCTVRHCTVLYCTALHCTMLYAVLLYSTVQVGYATALDVFIIICFMSVFTALIEFAFINFLDMFIRRLKHRSASDLKHINSKYTKLQI